MKRINLVEEGHYILTGERVLNDVDRVKYKLMGQLIGTLYEGALRLNPVRAMMINHCVKINGYLLKI